MKPLAFEHVGVVTIRTPTRSHNKRSRLLALGEDGLWTTEDGLCFGSDGVALVGERSEATLLVNEIVKRCEAIQCFQDFVGKRCEGGSSKTAFDSEGRDRNVCWLHWRVWLGGARAHDSLKFVGRGA